MRLHTYFLFFMLILFSGCTTSSPNQTETYVVKEKTRTSWRFLFVKKMPTPAKQWKLAQQTRHNKKLKKANKQLDYLIFTWPNSNEAPLAQRARADIFYARKEYKDAFDAYQYLINNYPSEIKDYNRVLENQLNIAVHIMKTKRMRWFFGGYQSPTRAVEEFEQIIRNGAQWEKAPHVQMLIGEAYEKEKEFELAIVAYSVLGFRYPKSPLAEDAAWRKIKCLEKLHKNFDRSPGILDRYLTATTYYLITYNNGRYKNKVMLLRNELYETKAKKAFERADFYATKADPRQPKAGILYYKKMITEYPKSKLVPKAKENLITLQEKVKKMEEKKAAEARKRAEKAKKKGVKND